MRVAEKLARSREALKAAQGRLDEARLAVAVESYQVRILEQIEAAGAGHSWTPWRLPRWVNDQPPVPCCRLCRLPVGSIASGRDCEGDGHECPELIPAEGAWEGACDQWGLSEGLVRCARRGKFGSWDLWRCSGGHVVRLRDHDSVSCQALRCPHPFMTKGESRRDV